MLELVQSFIDILLHLDVHLQQLIAQYGIWIYGILFAIIFCETGLVFFPFLPGDSLLFITGTLIGGGLLSPTIIPLLFIAAVLGDLVNYTIGHYFGHKMLMKHWVKTHTVNKATDFYDKHGAKSIVLARFVPLIRTFAPFVAGIAVMKPSVFLRFNIIGGALWVFSLTGLGVLLGENEWVKQHLTHVIYAIIILSVIPIFIEIYKSRTNHIKTF